MGFDVVLDTHGASLDDDLVALVQAGGRWARTAGTGAVPGSHHREGVLKFYGPVGSFDALSG